ncbi:MAG: Mut7-C RNAse domain-containing protein [Acidobacteria bacterium]|nr:Mut7-C RNAse domain-containing protein [Acidobacteriota bacterium]MCA1636926.1 Mut7-C RNAse domain-containing protein [Acidobacteriota bacterium]
MAISCVKCGRQYDVTLFQFGRTINCACGERVGFEHKINLSKDEETKFFADVNVARVVRWLRAIGIDTTWEDAISDEDLVRRAIEENRFVLTLDKKLTEEWRVDNVLLLQSENSLEQFQEIVEHFKIKKPKEFFTRCLVCNTFLRNATALEIAAGAPQRVRENEQVFHFCSNCAKLYWQGSHTRRMQEAIEKAFNSIHK